MANDEQTAANSAGQPPDEYDQFTRGLYEAMSDPALDDTLESNMLGEAVPEPEPRPEPEPEPEPEPGPESKDAPIVETRIPLRRATAEESMEIIGAAADDYQQKFETWDRTQNRFLSEDEFEERARKSTKKMVYQPGGGVRGWARQIPLRGDPESRDEPTLTPFQDRLATQADIAKNVSEKIDKNIEDGDYIGVLTTTWDAFKQSEEDIMKWEQVVDSGEFHYSTGQRRGEVKEMPEELDAWIKTGAIAGAATGAALGGYVGLRGGIKGAAVGALTGAMMGGMGGAGIAFGFRGSIENPRLRSNILSRFLYVIEAPLAAARAMENLSIEGLSRLVDVGAMAASSAGVEKVDEHMEDARKASKELETAVQRWNELDEVSALQVFPFVGEMARRARDAYLLSASRIAQASLATPEVRAQIVAERDRLDKLKKPDDFTWDLIKIFDKISEEPGRKENLLAELDLTINHSSYASLPEALRRNRLDVRTFRYLVRENVDDEWLTENEPLLNNHRYFKKAIDAVRENKSTSEIQEDLDKVAFGTFANDVWVPMLKGGKVYPSTEEIIKYGKEAREVVQMTGYVGGTRAMERTMGRMMLTKTVVGDEVLMPESQLAMFMRVVGAAPTFAAEIPFVDPETGSASPLLGPIERTVAQYITPASYDFANKLGLRDPDTHWLARAAAAVKTGNIGYQPAIADIMIQKNMKPGDRWWMPLQLLGLAIDSLIPWEKPGFMALGKSVSATAHIPTLLKEVARAPKGQGIRAAIVQITPSLYARIRGLTDTDALTAYEDAIITMSKHVRNKGDDPTGALDNIDNEFVDEYIRQVGIDPNEAREQLALALHRNRVGRASAMQNVNALGTPVALSTRMSDGYAAFTNSLDDLANRGMIERNHIPHIEAIFERQAELFALDPSVPEIRNPADFFRAFRIVADEGGAVRMGTAPDARGVSRDGVQVGAFEWNPATARGIISLFDDANEAALWHQNMNLVAQLMGDEWRRTLVKHFDSAPDAQGVRRLTDIGQEQIANAWTLYRRINDAPNGAVRRMFDQLWIGLQNFYSIIRRRPGVLPTKVKKFWDMQFGPDPRASAHAVNVVDNISKTKRPVVSVKSEKWAQIKEARPRKAGTAREMRRPRLDQVSIRQHAGRRVESFVDVMPDGKRIPGRRWAADDMDVVDLFDKAIAYVLTEQFRKKIKGTTLIRMGTGRTIVPEDRVARIVESVRSRYIDALKTGPAELAKRILQRRYDDVGALGQVPPLPRGHSFLRGDFVRFMRGADLPFGISERHVDALYDRMRLQHAGRFTVEEVQKLEIIPLKPHEAAGFQTLVQELAANPLGNKIPDSMLDPDTSFRMVTVDEFNVVQAVLTDTEAGVAARAARYAESISPTMISGFMRAISESVESGAKWVPGMDKVVQKIKKMFETPKLGEGYFDEGIRDLMENALRELGQSQQWIINLAANMQIQNPKASFYAFVHHVRRQLTPPVKLSLTRDLFEIHKALSGIDKSMDVAARAGLLADEVPAGFDPTVAGVELGYIYNKIDVIQSLMDDWEGMLPNEREAVIKLREYKDVANDALTDTDKTIIADAVRVIEMGLDVRLDEVTRRGRELWDSLVGSAGTLLMGDQEARQFYNMFYAGDIHGMFAYGSKRGLVGIDVDKPLQYDANKALVEMLVRMRANEIMSKLSRDLADYGLSGDIRKMGEFKAIGEDPYFDRTRFAQRVEYFIKAEINWRGRDVATYRSENGVFLWDRATARRELKEFEAIAGRPAPEMFGALERVRPGLDQVVLRSADDMVAYTMAQEMLAKWGFKYGRGEWEWVELPDGTNQLMPAMVAREIEDAFDRAAGIGKAYGRGKAQPERKLRVSEVLTKQKPTLKTRAKTTAGDVINLMFDYFPATPGRVQMAVTTGIAVPILPYFSGVVVGNIFQVWMGQGIQAALKDAGLFLPTMAGAASTRPDLVGAVMARLWKDGIQRPYAPAMITDDFRVLTADSLAVGARKYGLKSSQILAETEQALVKRLEGFFGSGFTKFMEKYAKGWQRTIVEFAAVIDNYFRLSVYIREIKKGRTPPDAARVARRIVFDYSELSEFEKAVFKNTIMFYSYFRKNTDLFFDTLAKNPERISAQIRLVRGSQHVGAEGEEPLLVFSEHSRTRAVSPLVKIWGNEHYYKGLNFYSPYLPVADAILLGTLPYEWLFGGEEESARAGRDLIGRLLPHYQYLIAKTYDMHPYFGRDIDRAPNQIPAGIVQLDFNMTGGMLWDFLGIERVPPDKIKHPLYQEVPGRGTYRATNGKNLYLFKSLFGFGRQMDIFNTLDRANTGAIEALVRITDIYREQTGGGLLQRSEWLNPLRGGEVGLGTWEGGYQEIGAPPIMPGTPPDAPEYITAAPRPGLIRPGPELVRSPDGVMEYTIDPKKFNWQELMAWFGFRGKFQKKQAVVAEEMLERHARDVEAKAGEMRRKATMEPE